MKTVLIYIFVALIAAAKFVCTKQIFDLVIDTSGGDAPAVNDKHYDFYVKDYFGLINGYAAKTETIKSHMKQDYKRWTEQLKSNKHGGLELLKSAYTKVIDDLTAYQNDVIMNYQEISPVAIVDIVKAVNYMRQSEKLFYSKSKLISQKCHDFVDRNLYYKWEQPALFCVHKKITKSFELQLQYTYDINVYYARFVDQCNKFAKISDGEKEMYVAASLKKLNEELMQDRVTQIKSIQNLLKDTQACAAQSYGVLEQLQKSFLHEAFECL